MTKRQLRAIIGENIRLERTARNLSIEELSEMLDITPGFVGLIERGHRGTTPNTLYRISDVFSLSIDSLFQPRESSKLSFREGEHSPTSRVYAKRKKIESMLAGFDDTEMDFIITVLKNVRNMRREGGAEGETEGEAEDSHDES